MSRPLAELTNEELVAGTLTKAYAGLGTCVELLLEAARRSKDGSDEAHQLLQWVVHWITTGALEHPADKPTREHIEELARTLRELADNGLPVLASLLD